MSRKRTIYVSLFVLILVASGGAVGYWLFLRSTKPAANDGIHAAGTLLPVVRRQVCYENGLQGTITKFDVDPGDLVPENRTLMHLHDVELEKHLQDLLQKRNGAIQKAEALDNQANSAPNNQEATSKRDEAGIQRAMAKSMGEQIDTIRAMMDKAQDAGGKGQSDFVVKAPRFLPEEAAQVRGRPQWTILNTTFKKDLAGRAVRPSDPLLRLGAVDGPWELEILIPQKRLGEVKLAFEQLHAEELDVDFLLRSDPTKKFLGKLRKDRIAGEANPSHDESSSLATGTSEPAVIAFVRIEPVDNDIPVDRRVPPELRVSGTELDAKIRSDVAR
jgi:multidrug efflux pump subunit AcrA (membrane-fusion protein)